MVLIRFIVGLAVVAFLFGAPGAAADPTFSAPDPTPLGEAATGALDETAADAVETHHANVENASHAVADLQLLTLPASEAQATMNNTGGFGARAVRTAGSLAAQGVGFATAAAMDKVREANETTHAVDAVGGAAVGAVGEILFAVLEVACSQPLVDLSEPAPPECAPGSLGGQALGLADDVAGPVTDSLDSQDGGQTREALRAVLTGVLGTLPA